MNGLSGRYMPRLDGLRAIAVCGVLFEHFCPLEKVRAVSPGGAGVTLFFVLSGYLITRILLQYRLRGVGIRTAAIHFYTRRFLRLSPAYYTAIAIAAFFGLAGLHGKWWIPTLYLAYLTNFQIAFHGTWPGYFDHFWSLAVEEQFYLLWFTVVVILPARYFIPSVAWAMMTALLFRVVVWVLALSPVTIVLLPGQMATLLAGALIAYAEVKPAYARLEQLFLSRRVLIWSSFAFALASLSLPYRAFPKLVSYPFVAALCFGCLVRQSADPSGPVWLKWLGWAPLAHIGKISYGIYVYHPFIPETAIAAVLGRSPWVVFAGRIVSSILIAEVSWFVLERRVLNFSNHVTADFLRHRTALPEAPATCSSGAQGSMT